MASTSTSLTLPVLPLEEITAKRNVGLVWRRGTPRQRLVQALLEAVTAR